MATRRPKERVLAVFANPVGSDPLRLGEEDKVLKECLRLARTRSLELDVRHAATVHDLRRALLDEHAHVVHFSGHGTGRGLAFEDDQGNPKLVPPAALAELLAAYVPPLHTVVLNACYSSVHSTAFGQIPFAIVMKQAVADRAAIEFSRGFYDALAAGKGTEFAYFEGLRTLKLLGLPDQDTPELIASGQVVPVAPRRRARPDEPAGQPLGGTGRDSSRTTKTPKRPKSLTRSPVPRLFAEFERNATPPHEIVTHMYRRKHFSIRLYIVDPPHDATRVKYKLHSTFRSPVHEVAKANKLDFTDWIESYGDFEIKVQFFATSDRLIAEIAEYLTDALLNHYGTEMDELVAHAIDVVRAN